MTPLLSRRLLLALLLGCTVLGAHAAEPLYLPFSELLQSDEARKLLDPNIRMYWGNDAAPIFPETTRLDVTTGTSLTGGIAGGSRKHCVAAFEDALDKMVRSARDSGYDTVLNIRAAYKRKPTADVTGFRCTPGFRTTEVQLAASFAMSPAAAKRAAEAQKQSANLPARPPAKNAIYVPLAPVLASPELKPILGRHVRAYWGIDAPEYDEHELPEEYSEDADIGPLGQQEACRQATLRTLEAMVLDARKKDFDSIIRIRSYHEEKFAPSVNEIECKIDDKSATVTLRAGMANRK